MVKASLRWTDGTVELVRFPDVDIPPARIDHGGRRFMLFRPYRKDLGTAFYVQFEEWVGTL